MQLNSRFAAIVTPVSREKYGSASIATLSSEIESIAVSVSERTDANFAQKIDHPFSGLRFSWPLLCAAPALPTDAAVVAAVSHLERELIAMPASQKQCERKRRKRTKRLQRKSLRRQVSELADQFPRFEVINQTGSTAFADALKTACQIVRREHTVRFDALTLRLLLAFRRGELCQEVRKPMPGFVGTFSDIARLLSAQLGEAILKAMPAEVRRNHLPAEFFEVTPRSRYSGASLLVSVNGLARIRTAGGTAFHSPYCPTVEIEGRHRLVAFTNHAIERIPERMVLNSRLHVAANDAHLFIRRCRYFEHVTLPNGQPAITFYTDASEIAAGRLYADRILQDVEPDTCYYHRLGYCPIAETGTDAVVAKTFLFPGMQNTPEHAPLRRKQRSVADTISDESDPSLLSVSHVIRSGDLRLLRWFHRNGVPQIRTFEENPFHEEPPRPLIGHRPFLLPIKDGDPWLSDHPVRGRVLPIFSAKPWASEYVKADLNSSYHSYGPRPAAEVAVVNREKLPTIGAQFGCRHSIINPAPGCEGDSALLDLERL